MIGMDRRSGLPLSGLAHLKQSVEDILTTPLGSRRMRPEYGSKLRRMVDMPVSEGWKSAVQAEVARSLGAGNRASDCLPCESSRSSMAAWICS